MTDDDIRLTVEELHGSILGWAYLTAQPYTIDEDRAGDAIVAIAESLRTMPPGWHEAWAEHVEEYRPHIDHAIALLRAAQRWHPASAADALRDYLEELCHDN